MAGFLQVHISIFSAAALVAFLTARGDWSTAVIVFAGSFGGMEGLVMFFLRRRLRGIARETRQFEDQVAFGTIDDARAGALAVLSDSKCCRPVVRSSSEPPLFLPATLREIFDKYQRVVFQAGDILELGPEDGGFIHVGKTFDGADLLVRVSDEGLFEVDASSPPATGTSPTYPSILHWVARSARH